MTWTHFINYYHIYVKNLPYTGGFPSKELLMWRLDVFFDVNLN